MKWNNNTEIRKKKKLDYLQKRFRNAADQNTHLQVALNECQMHMYMYLIFHERC